MSTYPSYSLTRWLFLRLLGAIYLIAFLSLRPQIPGLMGHNGLLPIARLLPALYQRLGATTYWAMPTLAWLNSSDRFLGFMAVAGSLLAVLAILGVATGESLAGCWVLYTSLVTAGGDFTQFQWDALLLEAGFLSLFLASWRLVEPHWKQRDRTPERPEMPGGPHVTANAVRRRPPRWLYEWVSRDLAAVPGTVWLIRWLLFRLMFSSGLAKLESHDPAWRTLTALDFHYFTQPLPTPIAWYMAKLPQEMEKASCLFMFVVELGAPFLIFAPRRLRLFGAGLLGSLQILMALTGNYGFFNLLALVLCITLLDDHLLGRVLPRPLASRITEAPASKRLPPFVRRLAVVLGFILAFLGLLEIPGLGRWRRNSPESIAKPLVWMEPLHLVNSYGLFAVMTTARSEVIVQGSDDGQNWRDYEFKYKPVDLRRAPPWVAPYQPRLDWQMWFAALGDARSNPWFVNFMVRLLEGSPEVLSLLAANPFPQHPPRYVRAQLYDYRFTSFADRRQAGDWWKRSLRGDYFPVAELRTSAGSP